MTVQTQARPGIAVSRRPIRGFKGFVFGMAALVAAGTGIGVAVSMSGTTRPAVTAPDSPQTASLKQLHAENYTHPASPEQLEALMRHHEDAQATSSGSYSEAIQRFKDDASNK